MKRLFSVLSICGLLVAQQDQQKPAEQQPDTRFGATVEYVQAAVTVLDNNGKYVNGLMPSQFRMFDNGKEQNIHSVDVTFTPMSLVVAIQASARVEKILPQVNKIGNLLKPIILGDQGEAAVIAYDSRVRTLQDFTTDSDKITKAVKTIYAGSTSSRLVDAVEQGARMLSNRPKDRRRIMLVIGETHDGGSEARGRETAIFLQLHNITVYWLDMSHLMGIMTASAPEARPDNSPPAMHPMPGGVPATPTTVQQMYGTNGTRAEFVPLMVEIFKDVKNIFKTSPAELFTKGTGGNEYSFYTQNTLERTISEIGDLLHSQYLVSYQANNKDVYGFHTIQVAIADHEREYRCQTRPGYWWAVK